MKILWLVELGLAAAISGCASAPDTGLEGGIVGTGNRPDCATLKRKGETLPPDCGVSEPPPYR